MTTTPAAQPAEPLITVDLWTDVVCPWCYVGEARLHEAIEAEGDADAFRMAVQWHPEVHRVQRLFTALVGAGLLVHPARRVAARSTGQWVVTRFAVPFVVVSDDAAAGWRFRSASEPDVVDVEGWEEPEPSGGDGPHPMLTPGPRT